MVTASASHCRATVLAADIGGTSGRFALFTIGGESLAMAARVELPSAAAGGFEALIRSALDGLAPLGRDLPAPAAAVLAVAGPVRQGRSCVPPNIPYLLDLDQLSPELLPQASQLVNDFTAQAHGCRHLGVEQSDPVLPGAVDTAETQAVIGPGTGLGKATLIPDGRGGFVVGGSEGGHAAFPFNAGEERLFQDFVLRLTGEPYVRWETVVSGSGLALLHRYLTGENLAPAQVAASLSAADATTEWFARFLGRACRDYVLEVVARGGVYVSGGVAAKNPLFLTHWAFEREFRASHTHPELMAGVGVRLVRDQNVGLWGAASLARQLAEAAPSGC
ncbi:glucokinase [Fundidesulfovibrio agrisoli]|uniref:glucokinase n=1 Tax=Fundidesulfovibrio agrisoli TaxID=2922717 RepID=UPI001FACBDEE|nr:glucokinase [Fundidesulfovibrio agrisoli]